MTWQEFFLAYYAIGLVTWIVLVAHTRFAASPDSSGDLGEIIEKRRRRFYPKWKLRLYYVLEKILGPAIGGMIASLVWPFLVCWKLKLICFPETKTKKKPFAVERGHLVERHGIEELEARERVVDPMGAVPDVPFGHLNVAWERLKQDLVEGDEVWSFSAPCETWRGTKGVESGYVILHNGEPGAFWVTDFRELEDDPAQVPAGAR